MLQMLGAFAEFEREMIRERTTSGMQAAKKRGVRLGPAEKPGGRRRASGRAAMAIRRLYAGRTGSSIPRPSFEHQAGGIPRVGSRSTKPVADLTASRSAWARGRCCQPLAQRIFLHRPSSQALRGRCGDLTDSSRIGN